MDGDLCISTLALYGHALSPRAWRLIKMQIHRSAIRHSTAYVACAHMFFMVCGFLLLLYIRMVRHTRMQRLRPGMTPLFFIRALQQELVACFWVWFFFFHSTTGILKNK